MQRLYTYGFYLLLVMNLTALVTFARDYTATTVQPATASTVEQLRNTLALSEVQARDIAAERNNFEARIIDERTGLRQLREELMSAMQMQEPDTSRIWRIVEDIASRQADIEKRAVELYLTERNTLTPAQQDAFHQHMMQCMRMGGRGGRWGQMMQDDSAGPMRPGRGWRGQRRR